MSFRVQTWHNKDVFRSFSFLSSERDRTADGSIKKRREEDVASCEGEKQQIVARHRFTISFRHDVSRDLSAPRGSRQSENSKANIPQ